MRLRSGSAGALQNTAERKVNEFWRWHWTGTLSETTDVAGHHPDIVKRLEAGAEKARQELGDALSKRTGKGTREPGRLANAAALKSAKSHWRGVVVVMGANQSRRDDRK
jgi:hypothetical protein